MQEKQTSVYDNIFGAAALSVVALTVLGLVQFVAWYNVFTIAVAWVLSDFVLNLWIRGGNRIVQIRPKGTTTVTKGTAYIAFFIGIIVATLVSTVFTDMTFRGTVFVVSSVPLTGIPLTPIQGNIMMILICNLIVGVLVGVDLQFRFYPARGEE